MVIKILLATLVFAINNPVAADVYKCPGPDGKLRYQQTPCPEGEPLSIQKPASSPSSPATGLRPAEVETLERIKARETRRSYKETPEQRRLREQGEAQVRESQRIHRCRYMPYLPECSRNVRITTGDGGKEAEYKIKRLEKLQECLRTADFPTHPSRAECERLYGGQ
jgi:hypothetical protein